MALGNPVVRIPGGGRLPGSRVLELGVVIALAVAVVGVAALWGSSSDRDAIVAVGSRGVASETSIAAPGGTAPTSSAAERAAAVGDIGEIEAAEPAAVSVAGARGSGGAAEPTQSWIVPGRSEWGGPRLPDSIERYQVQRGESLFTIASARGLSVADLAAWNWQLDEDSVLIRGEWIWIPQWNATTVAGESAPSSEEEKSGRGGG